MQPIISTQINDDDEYEKFLAQIQHHFWTTTSRNGNKLFTTNAVGLFDVFLGELPRKRRQHYTCNACRRFVDRFGALVTITPDGHAIPVIWPTEAVPELYRNSVEAAWHIVAEATVTGVYLPPQRVWGQPVTGEWRHMAVLANDLVFIQTVTTAHQVMAQKKKDYRTLVAGLVEFPLSAIEQAITLLKTDSLHRSEKALGVAEWLGNLHQKRKVARNGIIKKNLTWLAVATAPAGYCHIKSTMIGTLLEDIGAGLPFEAISRRFAEKMHPLQYQRPQAPPPAGNIAQAEKTIAQLQAAGSLARRFARFDEVKTIWQPQPPPKEKAGEGVFSHLKAKGKKPEVPNLKIPPQTMTWVKFLQTVLPDAKNVELYVSERNSFAALVTAANQDAPPIIQWDIPGNRNPVSWYIYHKGSSPERWNLTPGYCKVVGICYQPSMWNEADSFGHQGQGVLFLLDGAKDTGYQGAGNCLFPEILKSEFHSIRATIEAYSHQAKLEGIEDATANGLLWIIVAERGSLELCFAR